MHCNIFSKAFGNRSDKLMDTAFVVTKKVFLCGMYVYGLCYTMNDTKNTY